MKKSNQMRLWPVPFRSCNTFRPWWREDYKVQHFTQQENRMLQKCRYKRKFTYVGMISRQNKWNYEYPGNLTGTEDLKRKFWEEPRFFFQPIGPRFFSSIVILCYMARASTKGCNLASVLVRRILQPVFIQIRIVLRPVRWYKTNRPDLLLMTYWKNYLTRL